MRVNNVTPVKNKIHIKHLSYRNSVCPILKYPEYGKNVMQWRRFSKLVAKSDTLHQKLVISAGLIPTGK